MFSDPDFGGFAESVVLFVHNTSRVEGEAYPTLLRDKGFSGFPSLCFLDAAGEVLVVEQQRTVAALLATRARLGEWQILKSRSDAEARVPLFVVEAALGMLDRAALVRGLAELELDEQQRAAIDQRLVDCQIVALQERRRELGAAGLMQALVDIAKEGRRPTAAMVQQFWIPVLSWAAQNRDAELGQQAYDALIELGVSRATKARFRQKLRRAKR